jgi:hypothetical protein
VEEMNLEKNDEQDCHYMKKESFRDIVDESKILEVVGEKQKDTKFLILKTSHPIEDQHS